MYKLKSEIGVLVRQKDRHSQYVFFYNIQSAVKNFLLFLHWKTEPIHSNIADG